MNVFSNLEDEDLMAHYQKGENMAFDVIYLRYKDRVYSYLRKRLYDPEVVDDLFQGVFVKFHKSRDRYNSDFPLLKWIYTICRSEWVDYLKKKKLLTTELKDEHLVTADNFCHEIIHIENEKYLTENEKKAIELRYYSDEDFIEISNQLNTSESNVRKIISRGLKKLKINYSGGQIRLGGDKS